MTTESGDGTSTDIRAATSPDTSMMVGVVLKAAGARIRHDPVLSVPFAIVGLLVALADGLRKQDPIPVATPDWFEQTLSIRYSVFPMGTARTIRQVDALLDLRTPYFFGAIALELLVLLAIGTAGWLTITRAMDTERRLDSLARYLGVLSAISLPIRLLGTPTINVDGLLLGGLVLLTIALVLVHLFLFPGLLAAGCQVTTALRESVRKSRGKRWTLLWLIIIFGLASWGLAHLPIAGGFLSTAVVAPVHAVSLAILIQQNGRHE